MLKDIFWMDKEGWLFHFLVPSNDLNNRQIPIKEWAEKFEFLRQQIRIEFPGMTRLPTAIGETASFQEEIHIIQVFTKPVPKQLQTVEEIARDMVRQFRNEEVLILRQDARAFSAVHAVWQGRRKVVEHMEDERRVQWLILELLDERQKRNLRGISVRRVGADLNRRCGVDVKKLRPAIAYVSDSQRRWIARDLLGRYRITPDGTDLLRDHPSDAAARVSFALEVLAESVSPTDMMQRVIDGLYDVLGKRCLDKTAVREKWNQLDGMFSGGECVIERELVEDYIALL